MKRSPAQETPKESEDWLRLDNAAKIYPAASTDEAPAVFRLSITFDQPIRLTCLERAFARMLRRCPYYQVYLKKGVFWYYLQRHDEIPPVELLETTPRLLMPIRRKNTPLLRVQAREATVAIDFSHILTDGLGGMRFLVSLAADYLRLTGEQVGSTPDLLEPEDAPHREESEDGHKRHYEEGRPKPPRLLPRAYHLPGRPRTDVPYRFLVGRMPVSSVLELARSLGVSLTEYLVAVYIRSIAAVREADYRAGRPDKQSIVRIEVPVNMRPYYSSRTMRNFSLYVSPEIDLGLGDFSFDEIARRVHLDMRMQLDRKELQRQISRNVAGAEQSGSWDSSVLEVLHLSAMHRRLGAAPYSGILSNLGRIELPGNLGRHIKEFGFYLGPNPGMKKNCSVVSYNKTLTVAFGSSVGSTDMERSFFKTLVEAGVAVRIREY